MVAVVVKPVDSHLQISMYPADIFRKLISCPLSNLTKNSEMFNHMLCVNSKHYIQCIPFSKYPEIVKIINILKSSNFKDDPIGQKSI